MMTDVHPSPTEIQHREVKLARSTMEHGYFACTGYLQKARMDSVGAHFLLTHRAEFLQMPLDQHTAGLWRFHQCMGTRNRAVHPLTRIRPVGFEDEDRTLKIRSGRFASSSTSRWQHTL